jgi:hypothetical protein
MCIGKLDGTLFRNGGYGYGGVWILGIQQGVPHIFNVFVPVSLKIKAVLGMSSSLAR